MRSYAAPASGDAQPAGTAAGAAVKCSPGEAATSSRSEVTPPRRQGMAEEPIRMGIRGQVARALADEHDGDAARGPEA